MGTNALSHGYKVNGLGKTFKSIQRSLKNTAPLRGGHIPSIGYSNRRAEGRDRP
jgi:hypothetical protein